MTGNLNVNALNPSYFSLGYQALTQSVANPLYGAVSSTSNFGGPQVGQYQLLLPHPQFGEINFSLNDQDSAQYDSLVIKAQKRLTHGLTFLSTLTWARSFDQGNGGPGNFLNSGNASVPQNPYNLAGEWAPSCYDSPVRWATTFTYELPFGRANAFRGPQADWWTSQSAADLLTESEFTRPDSLCRSRKRRITIPCSVLTPNARTQPEFRLRRAEAWSRV